MRVVLQRVSKASVQILGTEEPVTRTIGRGLVVLAGVSPEDTGEDIRWLARKITGMRIFTDSDDKMNLSVQDVLGEILLVSQFTLFASTKKGCRPSFSQSAPPETAIPLFESLVDELETLMPGKIRTGRFGAHMEVSLVNDGPVTITMDSRNRE